MPETVVTPEPVVASAAAEEAAATQPQPEPAAQPVYEQPQPVYTQPQESGIKAGLGLAIACLACGVMSINMAFCYGFGWPFSIAGLILAGKARAAGHTTKMVPAGRICSIVGLVLSIIVTLIWVVVLIAAIANS